MAENWTIDSVRSALGAKKISARELAKEYFSRIAAQNPKLNVYLALSEERAYAQADRVDAMVAAGKPLPALAGVPVAADEVTDVNFAFIATRLRREQLSAKFKRLKRRGARSLLFVGLVLVTLNFLFCMAYALFSLTLEAAPL